MAAESASIKNCDQEIIHVSKTMRDKTLFIIGSTGFLGKVYLYLILRRHIDVERIYCLVRPKKGKTPDQRLREEVMGSPCFDPLRERLGQEAFEMIVGGKLEAVAGDISEPNLGIAPDMFEVLEREVDVLINSSGLVDFNPPLDDAITVNAVGLSNVVHTAEAWKVPFLHVSTCYVAGVESGIIFEDRDILGWFPNKDKMEGVELNLERELRESLELAEKVREEATFQELQSHFKHDARQRLKRENRNPEDPELLAVQVKKVQERWVSERLTEYGLQRAKTYGWTNTYTYSKSLGEQVVAGSKVPWAIVRPSIIESSLRFPFPGWNEGINTSAPLAFLSIKGQLGYPSGKEVMLDLIPVDMVAAGMLAVTAALLEGRQKKVYQLASSDLNPCRISRVIELVGLHKRRYYRERTRGNPLLNEIFAQFEAKPISLDSYNLLSSPMAIKVADTLARASERVARGHSRGVYGFAKRLGKESRKFEKQARAVDDLMTLFMPFTVHNKYRFRCENIRALYGTLSPEDRATMPWDPEAIDWMDYWLEVHLRGLEKWVFPRIKDKLQKNPLPKVYTYRDLLELFDAATVNHAEATAFRLLSADGREEKYTYAEVRERAQWVATWLQKAGVGPGDRVLLCSENLPQWGMAYFGILVAGGACVPVDGKSTERELSNLARASGARAVILSDKNHAALGEKLEPLLAEDTHLMRLSEVVRPVDSLVCIQPGKADGQLASVIYTSGTTGEPKGVMLKHGNFTHLLSAMAKIFRMNEHDRILSVLPLHHTFEFTTGFLLPFSRGAAIAHIDELTGELVAEALKRYKITAMVGVPALWELLYRRIRSKVKERGAFAEGAFLTLHWLHRALREKSPLNIGPYLFSAVHQGFGGRMRYMISGGAALPSEVQRGFDGFGMTLYEGYGLTEAAPVLTVNHPGKRPKAGSVGTALPGVKVEILNPDDKGVGEIVARGPNVMVGYFQDQEATDEVIKDGWLHTGDLGRLDHSGRLYIVGRRKEVIIDASGKNIYPDEVEELYAGCSVMKELSVVGLPDGRGSEQVACLVMAETEGAAEGKARDEVRQRIEDHFRTVGLSLPYHQRVKVLRFSESDLPRTATRKVKRREVIKRLEAILKAEEVTDATGEPAGDVAVPWLIEVVARVTGTPQTQIKATTRFSDELGIDSLMATELLAALEDKSGGALELQDLLDAHTIEGLAKRLRKRPSRTEVKPVSRKQLRRTGWKVDLSKLHEVEVAPVLRQPTKDVLRAIQRVAYERLLKVKVRGRAFIPTNRNVLVISNHSSHLDMGLVKTALGAYGEDLVTLAAADYFFAEGPKRFYFENFTNVMPLDRLNPSRESIWKAERMLQEGHNLLLFPEGTRSRSGALQTFKRGVGMMALKFGVDVLPIYIRGAYDAYPPGKMLPRRRDMEVCISAPVRFDDLVRLTRDMPTLQAQTLVTQILQQAVECLRDRRFFDLQAVARAGQPKTQLEQLFEGLERTFDSARVEKPMSFYFSLGPEKSQKWSIEVTETACRIKIGKPDGKADCVLKTSVTVFARIVRESYVPSMTEFMNGTVKTNDPSGLQQFQAIFNL